MRSFSSYASCLGKGILRSIGRLFFTTISGATSLHPFAALEFSSLLKQCKSLHHVKSVHQQIVVRAVLTSGLDNSSQSLMKNYLSIAYIACGAQADALFALEKLFPSSIFCWNILIRQAIKQDHLGYVLYLCRHMQCLGTQPDHFTFPFVLKACGELRSFSFGTSIHAVICKNGFDSNVFVCNALIAMYARCSILENAAHLFNEILCRGFDDIVSWNSMVAAYVQNGTMRLALDTFKNMRSVALDAKRELKPDVISLVNILPACASLQASCEGQQIHSYALKSGLFSDVFVGNAIVDMYAKCAMMADANKFFGTMEVKDVVSWNAMVTGYSRSGDFECALALFKKMHEENIALNVVTWSAVIAGFAQRDHAHEAIDVFRQMQLSGSEPNAVTLISLLSACASLGALRQGMETHSYAIKHCLLMAHDANSDRSDPMVHNALIDMYSKCKNIVSARTLFDKMSTDRDVVTWTVMIGGYAQHGDANTAVNLFSQMILDFDTDSPNDYTISCVLIACARLSALHFSKQIHAFIIRHKVESVEVFVANCLIDAYSKCGDIDSAQRVFNNMPLKNDVSWTSLMTGFGMHGRGDDALQIFQKMQEVGIVPDAIILLVILYVCSHAGMVAEGLMYFHNMDRDFGLVAGVEHYACVVDLLGRAGRLEEAKELIVGMPMKPTMIVWVALLNACRIHSNVHLGEYASQKLLELDYETDGSYTLLSNIYANARRWKDVARIRYVMKKIGVKKRPGCSWIQGKKGAATFTFFVGDRSHPQSQQIYSLLANLTERIKAFGYMPQTDFALHDVDDEEKATLLSEHSEKLALAFGILTFSPGMPIRITKNLRVCGDCHSFFTYISMIAKHEVILRDPSRFHHFKNGSCSCGGYW